MNCEKLARSRGQDDPSRIEHEIDRLDMDVKINTVRERDAIYLFIYLTSNYLQYPYQKV